MKAPKITGMEFKSVFDLNYKTELERVNWDFVGEASIVNHTTEHHLKIKTPEGYMIKEVVMVKIDEIQPKGDWESDLPKLLRDLIDETRRENFDPDDEARELGIATIKYHLTGQTHD